MHRDARICGNADSLRAPPGYRGNAIFKIGIRTQKLAYSGHERLTILGQRNTAVVAVDECQTDIALEAVDKMRQPGLSIADHLGCLGKAAEVDCGHEYFELFTIHFFSRLRRIKR